MGGPAGSGKGDGGVGAVRDGCSRGEWVGVRVGLGVIYEKRVRGYLRL